MKLFTNGGKNIGILIPSNTGPDPLKDHKTTKPALNVGSSLALQDRMFVGDGNLDLHVSTCRSIFGRRKGPYISLESIFQPLI